MLAVCADVVSVSFCQSGKTVACVSVCVACADIPQKLALTRTNNSISYASKENVGDVRGRANKTTGVGKGRGSNGLQVVPSHPLPPCPQASPPLLPLGYKETEMTATQAAVWVETVTGLIWYPRHNSENQWTVSFMPQVLMHHARWVGKKMEKM